MARRVKHYLGKPFARQAACGRFVTSLDNGKRILVTDDLLAVTCRECGRLI